MDAFLITMAIGLFLIVRLAAKNPDAEGPCRRRTRHIDAVQYARWTQRNDARANRRLPLSEAGRTPSHAGGK